MHDYLFTYYELFHIIWTYSLIMKFMLQQFDDFFSRNVGTKLSSDVRTFSVKWPPGKCWRIWRTFWTKVNYAEAQAGEFKIAGRMNVSRKCFIASYRLLENPDLLKYCTVHCTEVSFASFLSGRFTTLAVTNLLERKLAKGTSVHCSVMFPIE